MTNLGDLEKLETLPEPTDFSEWLGRFSDDERDLVIEKIITANADAVYAVISKLKENPYPFRRKTFNQHKLILRKGI